MDTISAFAQRVGLTPSALRFYDDCGVLRPARVDPASGYRYYSAEQQRPARLLRHLREAQLPLADITTVLTGGAAQAQEMLNAHSLRLRAEADAAHAALDTALRLITGTTRTVLGLGGAELASAVRQVHPAAARPGDHPALSCVLRECSASDLRLVATDRYRSAVRELVPHRVEGPPARVLVPADTLATSAQWAARQDSVSFVISDTTTHLAVGEGTEGSDSTDTVALPTCDDEYPDYRRLLDALTPPHCRIIADRGALLEALTAAVGDYLELAADQDGLCVGESAVPAHCSRPVRLAFDPAALTPVVASGVGPEVLLESTGPDEPVVVRSADQGSFTTLVMPVRAR